MGLSVCSCAWLSLRLVLLSRVSVDGLLGAALSVAGFFGASVLGLLAAAAALEGFCTFRRGVGVLVRLLDLVKVKLIFSYRKDQNYPRS